MDDCEACGAAGGVSVNGTCRMLMATVVCRGASGACDVQELCDGDFALRPTDVFSAQGTSCDDGAPCNGREL